MLDVSPGKTGNIQEVVNHSVSSFYQFEIAIVREMTPFNLVYGNSVLGSTVPQCLCILP